uniref:Uncharacterized protein n=1 Tax=Panagrolaimus superbus TaxID=310955 RepID=A0A914ZBJ3_9BILA
MERWAKNWDDLISVSLILDTFGFYDLQTFQNLFQCIPEASKKISAHLVWRTDDEKRECTKTFILKGLSNLPSNSDSFNCSILDEQNELFNSTLSNPYPPNSLRNIAREGATTNFHLISDIENNFSQNSSKILSISATKYIRENDKVAVIVRKFEYNDTYSEPPKTVNDLNELMKQKQAFEFHHFTYSKAHKIAGLEAWLNYSLTTNSSPSVKSVTYQMPMEVKNHGSNAF